MKTSFVIGIALLLLLAGSGVYIAVSGDNSARLSMPNLRLPGQEIGEPGGGSNEPIVPAGWRKFENTQYSFSVYVPPELEVSTYDEGGGAHTFIFESEDAAKGFQVFAIPYHEETISDERFRKDVPSGVRKEPIETMIDGARAVTFFSENAIMGETREVWFIKGGYLYEVTTYKPLDGWLAEIMETWRFIK